jgi:hypothetical protein
MPRSLTDELKVWAYQNWPFTCNDALKADMVQADGSPRLFMRLADDRGRSLVAMANPDNHPENLAYDYLAGHLAGAGVFVPRIMAKDLEKGFFLLQDLGSLLLQEKALSLDKDKTALVELYRPVVAVLALMQRKAARNLAIEFCFDGSELTPEFLRKREAGYFWKQFAVDALGVSSSCNQGLDKEFDQICRLAGEAGPLGFVHRDFQSRNILLTDSGPGVVDFQGGRLGPAQYDLASLLHDPYVDLPWPVKEELFEVYLELQEELGPFDQKAFRQGWPMVSACRIMQALGAYAFLTRVRGRVHFGPYAAPALAALKRLAGEPAFCEFSAFGDLVEDLILRFDPGALSPRHGGE